MQYILVAFHVFSVCLVFRSAYAAIGKRDIGNTGSPPGAKPSLSCVLFYGDGLCHFKCRLFGQGAEGYCDDKTCICKHKDIIYIEGENGFEPQSRDVVSKRSNIGLELETPTLSRSLYPQNGKLNEFTLEENKLRLKLSTLMVFLSKSGQDVCQFLQDNQIDIDAVKRLSEKERLRNEKMHSRSTYTRDIPSESENNIGTIVYNLIPKPCETKRAPRDKKGREVKRGYSDFLKENANDTQKPRSNTHNDSSYEAEAEAEDDDDDDDDVGMNLRSKSLPLYPDYETSRNKMIPKALPSLTPKKNPNKRQITLSADQTPPHSLRLLSPQHKKRGVGENNKPVKIKRVPEKPGRYSFTYPLKSRKHSLTHSSPPRNNFQFTPLPKYTVQPAVAEILPPEPKRKTPRGNNRIKVSPKPAPSISEEKPRKEVRVKPVSASQQPKKEALPSVPAPLSKSATENGNSAKNKMHKLIGINNLDEKQPNSNSVKVLENSVEPKLDSAIGNTVTDKPEALSQLNEKAEPQTSMTEKPADKIVDTKPKEQGAADAKIPDVTKLAEPSIQKPAINKPIQTENDQRIPDDNSRGTSEVNVPSEPELPTHVIDDETSQVEPPVETQENQTKTPEATTDNQKEPKPDEGSDQITLTGKNSEESEIDKDNQTIVPTDKIEDSVPENVTPNTDVEDNTLLSEGAVESIDSKSSNEEKLGDTTADVNSEEDTTVENPEAAENENNDTEVDKYNSAPESELEMIPETQAATGTEPTSETKTNDESVTDPASVTELESTPDNEVEPENQMMQESDIANAEDQKTQPEEVKDPSTAPESELIPENTVEFEEKPAMDTGNTKQKQENKEETMTQKELNPTKKSIPEANVDEPKEQTINAQDELLSTDVPDIQKATEEDKLSSNLSTEPETEKEAESESIILPEDELQMETQEEPETNQAGQNQGIDQAQSLNSGSEDAGSRKDSEIGLPVSSEPDRLGQGVESTQKSDADNNTADQDFRNENSPKNPDLHVVPNTTARDAVNTTPQTPENIHEEVSPANDDSLTENKDLNVPESTVDDEQNAVSSNGGDLASTTGEQQPIEEIHDAKPDTKDDRGSHSLEPTESGAQTDAKPSDVEDHSVQEPEHVPEDEQEQVLDEFEDDDHSDPEAEPKSVIESNHLNENPDSEVHPVDSSKPDVQVPVIPEPLNNSGTEGNPEVAHQHSESSSAADQVSNEEPKSDTASPAEHNAVPDEHIGSTEPEDEHEQVLEEFEDDDNHSHPETVLESPDELNQTSLNLENKGHKDSSVVDEPKKPAEYNNAVSVSEKNGSKPDGVSTTGKNASAEADGTEKKAAANPAVPESAKVMDDSSKRKNKDNGENVLAELPSASNPQESGPNKETTDNKSDGTLQAPLEPAESEILEPSDDEQVLEEYDEDEDLDKPNPEKFNRREVPDFNFRPETIPDSKESSALGEPQNESIAATNPQENQSADVPTLGISKPTEKDSKPENSESPGNNSTPVNDIEQDKLPDPDEETVLDEFTDDEEMGENEVEDTPNPDSTDADVKILKDYILDEKYDEH